MSSGFRVLSSGFRVLSFWFLVSEKKRVQGSSFKVQRLGDLGTPVVWVPAGYVGAVLTAMSASLRTLKTSFYYTFHDSKFASENAWNSE